MAKVKAPLLGFGATGTLDNSLTYRKKPGRHEVISIPTHPDAQTLAQIYQRWRYIDAIFYWKSLSDAQKTAFRADGSRHHLTGYQECLRQYMRLPFDQVLWLKCDINTAPTTPDSSKHGNTGTVYGASPAIGKIDRCFSFDGVNDYLDCGGHSSLQIPGALTILMWVNVADFGEDILLNVYNGWRIRNQYMVFQDASKLRFNRADGVGAEDFVFTNTLSTNTWTHTAFVDDGVDLLAYVNAGTPNATAKTITPTSEYFEELEFGRYGPFADYWYRGLLDDIRIYTRGLSPEHIDYIATQELYPPPV